MGLNVMMERWPRMRSDLFLGVTQHVQMHHLHEKIIVFSANQMSTAYLP